MKTTDASMPLTTTRKQHWEIEQARSEPTSQLVDLSKVRFVGVTHAYAPRAF